ncbi:MAG: hypothetical protein WCL44_10520 [bacterium]
MLDKLVAKLKSLMPVRAVFDPSRFGDPVAVQTAWTPVKGGGTNFQTHKLTRVEANRIEFRATLGAKLFGGIFLMAGLAVMCIVPASQVSSGMWSAGLLIPVLMGAVFAGLGGGMLYWFTSPIVFDATRGFFWKGRRSPGEAGNISELKTCVRLGDIHALQIISEYCTGNKSSYYSYELNMVMADASRINVVDHGNLAKLRSDARVLAEFLGKPLWDAL